MTLMTLPLILTGILIHLVVDWFFQDGWMAQNKMLWLKYGPHPAGIVHAAQHAFVMLLIFPWPAAFLVGFLHWVIDLRKPLIWWRSTSRRAFVLRTRSVLY